MAAASWPSTMSHGWLVPPDNPPQRVADTRRSSMRLSALFEEFCQYLGVEKEAAPRSIGTYRWCFGDFVEFARGDVGGTVLVDHFTADRCRAYQYALAARGLQPNTIRVRLATLASFGKWAVGAIASSATPWTFSPGRVVRRGCRTCPAGTPSKPS